MRSFEGGFIERQPVTQSLLLAVGALREFKGKEALFKEQSPQALETLRQVAIIQSTESSNRIEGVTAPLERIQALIAEKTTPKNRSEQEITGYRDVLNTIHSSYTGIPLTANVVLQLHRDLFQYSESPGGVWKAADNAIEEIHPDGSRIVRFRPVPAHSTPEAMEELHRLFNTAWNVGQVDKLLLIPAYVLDFLCIHPFRDGNGRMARLLSLLLLYHASYEVGRYISLEKIVEETKETYYEALGLSSQGWHEGEHDLMPWTDYFLGVMTGAYRRFEERVGTLTSARGAKTQMVLDAVQRLPNVFRMVDLERAAPNVTREMIRVVLRQLKKSGEVWGEGSGRGAVWRKRGNNS